MDVSPFLFHHAEVTSGWRSGKDTVKNVSKWLKFHNNFFTVEI